MKKLLLLSLLALSLLAKDGAVLALQWFPSVCKVERYKECRRPLDFWTSHFTLHGLWPKAHSYCHVSLRAKILDKRGYWEKIPLKLTPELSNLLHLYMPGSLSGLHKHEWVKHGSCYSDDPQRYFLDAIGLADQLNHSYVRTFFVEHRGELIQTYTIRKAFDRAFGYGSGKRVKVICKRGYIIELRINLAGKISAKTPLSQLLRRAPKTRLGCKIGRIAR